MIEIGLCADEKFAMPCGVCITSIFESNRNNKVRVHILTNGFSEETTRRMEQLAQEYGQTINIYNIDSSEFDSLPINFDCFSVMTYARLLFPKVLSSEIDKLIYLDCDIVVVGDLIELWDVDIKEYALGAAIDILADNIVSYNRLDIYDYPHINAGVLLLNLSEWRENNLASKCVEFVDKNPEKCHWQDQDAINAVLSDQIKLLDFKFNLMTLCMQMDIHELIIHKKYWSNLAAAKDKPTILHYASPVKPWHREYEGSFKQHFIDAMSKSPWRGCKIRYKLKGKQLVIYLVGKCLRKLKNKLT